MRKRIFAVLLSACMALSLTSTPAFAGGDVTGTLSAVEAGTSVSDPATETDDVVDAYATTDEADTAEADESSFISSVNVTTAMYPPKIATLWKASASVDDGWTILNEGWARTQGPEWILSRVKWISDMPENKPETFYGGTKYQYVVALRPPEGKTFKWETWVKQELPEGQEGITGWWETRITDIYINGVKADHKYWDLDDNVIYGYTDPVETVPLTSSDIWIVEGENGVWVQGSDILPTFRFNVSANAGCDRVAVDGEEIFWYYGQYSITDTALTLKKKLSVGRHTMTAYFGEAECSVEFEIKADPAVTNYTVTFNSDGGSAVTAQTVADGGKVVQPADPKRDGYVFDGWYLGDKKWDLENDPVYHNITLTAHWKPVTTPPASNPDKPIVKVPGKGTSLKSGKTTYKVTKSGKTGGTVTYAKTSSTASKVSVPATVKIGGISYKVTNIANNAFKGNRKLTKVNVGRNVTSIGTNAFANCPKLSKVTIGDNVTSVGAKAFANCPKLTKITIPAKVKKIGKQAFTGCKKLKTITIKSTKLTKKSVAAKAFSGVSKKATVKVPKSKVKAYKKLFQSKGLSKKVKVVKG